MVDQDPAARMAPPAFPRAGHSRPDLEPLPGEKLSKWKTHQHLPMEPKDVEANDQLPVPEAVRFAPLSPLLPLEQTETEDRASHDARGGHDGSEEIASHAEHHSSDSTVTSHIPTGMSRRPCTQTISRRT